MTKPSQDVTDAELAVLQVLWGEGPATIRQLTDAIYPDSGPGYYATVQTQPNGAATTTPTRDGLGRKETSSYNSDTGAITTRYEDDLGTGTVTERTSLPNGASVETVTPGAGPSLPVTTVTGPDGHKTILAPSQDPGGSSTQGIKHDLADGKSIDQIAKENGLTNEQVIAELQAAGYQVTSTSSSDAQSIEMVDPRTGDKTVYSHDYQHDVRTVTTTADGKETSLSVDGNGTETKTVTDKDGRVTTTTTEKINGGKPVEYEVKPDDNLTRIAEQYGDGNTVATRVSNALAPIQAYLTGILTDPTKIGTTFVHAGAHSNPD